MKKRFLFLVLALVALGSFMFAPEVAAQQRTAIVTSKQAVAAVTRTTTGDFWATGQASLNFNSALIRIVPVGSPSGCTVTIKTGPTAALATVAVDDANAVITCTSAVNKVVNSLDKYFNATLSLTGGTNATLYVTLTNGVGWALNQTLSAVTQGAGAGSRSSLWATQPGYDTNAYKDVKAGVGVQGAGVQQHNQLGTLSAVVANTLTEVVAVTTGGAKTVIVGVWVESAVATTAVVDVKYGTGTNCATGTTTLASLKAAASNPLAPGFYPLPALVVADKATCIGTEAAGTTARLITQ